MGRRLLRRRTTSGPTRLGWRHDKNAASLRLWQNLCDRGVPTMKTMRLVYSSAAAVSVSAVLALLSAPITAGQQTADAVRIDADDIGGVVTGAKGPEAGVWV